MTNNSPTLLTRAQVAAEFQVKPATVTEWMKRGLIVGIRLNKRVVRFKRSDVDRIMDGRPQTSL